MIVNGGTDMLMISGGKLMIDRILKHAKRAVERNFVLEKRLDESVVRILAVKMALGLIVKANADEEPVHNHVIHPTSIPHSSVGNEYQDSLNAVH
jgi:beta-glucosidase-like glycosyl hydrolase